MEQDREPLPPALNTVLITGRVRRKKHLAMSKGRYVLEFEVEARRYGETRAEDDPVDVFTAEAWGATARELDKDLNNGDPVLIEGRLISREYEDRNSNRRHRMILGIGKLNILGG